ncbi:MAG TPA: GAF domain-containing protein, partial [Candidatus Krumholzibacteria bacterium]|nr:GAF domain-containing protein [Candidatus Krumholzibacteria bacterium]
MPSETSTIGADQSMEELRRELVEAREQQAATADVLKVISRSALNVQRVLDALVESAAHLCNAHDSGIFQVFGNGLRLVAHHGQIPTAAPVGQLTRPLVRGAFPGRAVIDRRTIQVADILAEGDEFPESHKIALQLGYRTALAVPLVHAGEVIGVIFIRRTEVRPFTERQIELVNTFADQAVIAIENSRLFEAEQASKRELQESLEYQTATSDVLNVISRSPTDVQPVFDVIAKSAARLCSAMNCFVYRFDGELIHFAAAANLPPEGKRAILAGYPLPPSRASAVTRAILNGTVEEIADIEADPHYELKASAKSWGYRSIVAVPMLKDGGPIGAIAVSRAPVGLFARSQIDLLKTFADQAVIAIENARLFEAEQTRTRELTERTQELTETLEYQTATSDVLSVIAASPTDIQPVLQTLVESACQLCAAYDGIILLRDGEWLQVKAHHGPIPANVAKRKIT